VNLDSEDMLAMLKLERNKRVADWVCGSEFGSIVVLKLKRLSAQHPGDTLLGWTRDELGFD